MTLSKYFYVPCDIFKCLVWVNDLIEAHQHAYMKKEGKKNNYGSPKIKQLPMLNTSDKCKAQRDTHKALSCVGETKALG